MDSKKQSQISISSDNFEGILESIGYKLIDCGDHWRTRAVYRDGDNDTALKIYKNTGVWMDFVQNKGSKPFEALIKETLRDNPKELAKILGGAKREISTIYQQKETIQMEKIYPESSLDKLFPTRPVQPETDGRLC